ncbi:MAG: hypothetical protein PVJ02_03890 [Gemmatimonadota bacterium]|jgi:hypothetical protein
MYVAAARDIDSIFFLDARLSKAREAVISMALRGEPVDPEFMEQKERGVVEDLKTAYFNARVREAVQLERLSDEEDYANHSQKLVERAIWWTHERMKAIPFVGQEGFEDD